MWSSNEPPTGHAGRAASLILKHDISNMNDKAIVIIPVDIRTLRNVHDLGVIFFWTLET